MRKGASHDGTFPGEGFPRSCGGGLARHARGGGAVLRAQGLRRLWRVARGARGAEGTRPPCRGSAARGLHECRRVQLPPDGLRQQRHDHALRRHGRGADRHRGGAARSGGKPDDCTVVGFAGDGGTADIGLQALSGAIDRNDDVLYICYDNEAYMNTGIQKSSLTPFGAKTTTTPAGSGAPGCLTPKKSLFEIVAAHGIPYAATASVGYLPDFMRKVERAAAIRGTKYLHVMAPCPTGWGCGVDETVELARQVVDCGLWYLAEYEGPAVSGVPGGTFRVSRRPRKEASVGDYLRRQRRFSALSDEDVAAIEAARDAQWQRLEAWG